MAIGTGAAIIGGLAATGIAAEASRKKTKRSIRKAEAANVAEAKRAQDIYNQELALSLPFRQAGLDAYQKLISGDFDVKESPGFKFTLKKSEEALDKRLAKQGKLGSGEAIRRDLDITSQISSQQSQQYFSNLYNLAGLGASQPLPQAPAGPNIAGTTLAGGAADARFAEQLGGTAAGLPGLYLDYQQLFGGGGGVNAPAQATPLTPATAPLKKKRWPTYSRGAEYIPGYGIVGPGTSSGTGFPTGRR